MNGRRADVTRARWVAAYAYAVHALCIRSLLLMLPFREPTKTNSSCVFVICDAFEWCYEMSLEVPRAWRADQIIKVPIQENMVTTESTFIWTQPSWKERVEHKIFSQPNLTDFYCAIVSPFHPGNRICVFRLVVYRFPVAFQYAKRQIVLVFVSNPVWFIGG